LIPTGDDDGTVEFLAEGDSYSPLVVHGPCTPKEDWPVLCNPAVPNSGLEYPYCVFEASSSTTKANAISTRQQDDADNNVICARSGERVMVTQLDGTMQECSCLYFNPLLGPTSSCPMVQVNLSSPFVDITPTSMPTPGGNTSNDRTLTPTPNEESSATHSTAAFWGMKCPFVLAIAFFSVI
jgi:hypothetical protein